MKLSALIIACTASLLASPARADVRVSFDFFQESLSPYGEWCDTDRYGLVWQPSGVDRDWSPYSDGYWSYTDAGWTWVSYEDFGGITYHYGRWVQLDDSGWCWVPGYDWGPAWVSWRKSDEYVGWAPLPPEARWEVKVGISSWSDTHYDVGPGYYSFCRSSDFGAPVLRHVIVPRSRNVTIINVTNNITNITYNHDRGYVFNGGLDYDYIAPRCSHSLPALKLVRNTTNNYFVTGNRGNVFINSQKGNALYVSAPPRAESNWNVPTKKPTIAKVYNTPRISRGWAGADKEGVREKLLVKMREETRGATPDTQRAHAFKAASIAVVPKKADPTAPRPSLLKAQANRGDDRKSDGPEILKKPISRPTASADDRKSDGPENLKKPISRPASQDDEKHVGPGILKKPVARPVVTNDEKNNGPRPTPLGDESAKKKQTDRPPNSETEQPRRSTDSPIVFKKSRADERQSAEERRPTVIPKAVPTPKDDGGLRRKVAEQAEREKDASAERAKEAAMAREKASRERDAQESRSREIAKQRDAEESRRMTVEKQRRSAEESNARQKQIEAQRNSDSQEKQRRAAQADSMRKQQESAQREAAANVQRRQSEEILKQRRSAEQDNARRAAAAADSQRRQQQQAEMSRRASDEARQRQMESARQQQEAMRRQAAQQIQRPPTQQPSAPNSKRQLTPEEQEALLKKKRSR